METSKSYYYCTLIKRVLRLEIAIIVIIKRERKERKENWALIFNSFLFRLKEILAGLGLTLLSFRSCRYSYCSGTYRKLISYPYGLKWKMKMAPPLSMPLPTSSLETSPVAMDAATALTGNGDGVPVTIQEPNESSIEMDFRLDPGSYVTTMLNEILIGNI